jgi:hypothetical protein
MDTSDDNLGVGRSKWRKRMLDFLSIMEKSNSCTGYEPQATIFFQTGLESTATNKLN